MSLPQNPPSSPSTDRDTLFQQITRELDRLPPDEVAPYLTVQLARKAIQSRLPLNVVLDAIATYYQAYEILSQTTEARS